MKKKILILYFLHNVFQSREMDIIEQSFAKIKYEIYIFSYNVILFFYLYAFKAKWNLLQE